MSNLVKSYAPILLASVGMMISLPAMGAESGAVSGSSIVKCSGSTNQDFVDKVCLPLQQYADGLLGTSAKAPDPVVMKEPLNMNEYRAKGVDAIIQFQSTTGQSSTIPSGGTTTTEPETPWHL